MESDKAVSGETREKDCYKQKIIDMINGIERVDLLIYLCKLIQNIIKAGR